MDGGGVESCRRSRRRCRVISNVIKDVEAT